MGTAERRNEILKLLCRRRHETVHNLASEFGVSERTIRRDIEVLSLSAPIYTQSGRYHGGIYVIDGYYMDQMYMTDCEVEVLQKLSSADNNASILTIDERKVLSSIISLYSKPQTMKGRKI